MLTRWYSYVNNERGSQALQFLGLFPLILLSMLIIWQVGLISYSVVVAEAAARDGARAASAHDANWEEIARNSAYGLEVVVTGGPGEDVATVKVKAKAPIISLPWIKNMEFDFTADAVMPMEKKRE
ncbi:TadE/TadG family type IV pilus assembly protein [Saccharococcus sp. Marseille-Q5394]|uniref:TadE/TadG family type IV pilus assembly protein n=1 Tax=Saccharococcus sp. Marseille-Q5394 TaxID=2972778 RepID=UPI0021C9E8F8|nr:TadE/TadG family type IV pilus assembly protein [Saccharococcus sp. Marseille-Q5394]